MARGAVLGLNRTQDASACLFIDSKPVCLQKERVTRKKHDWGRPGDLELYEQRMFLRAAGVDLVVECYSSDREKDRRGQYLHELREQLGSVEVVEVSHHLAHVYSAFFPSGFSDAAVMIVDCQGSRVCDITEVWPQSGAGRDNWLEVASFYHCHGDDVRCIGKHLWEGDMVQPAGLGLFYALLTATIFPGLPGQEGKVMGLAPYGDPAALRLPPLEVEKGCVNIPIEWMEVFYDRNSYRYERPEGHGFVEAANLAAAGQAAFEGALLIGWQSKAVV